MSDRDALIHRVLAGDATPEELGEALALKDADDAFAERFKALQDDQEALQRLPAPTPPASLRSSILDAVAQPPPRVRAFGVRALAIAASVAFCAGAALAWGLASMGNRTIVEARTPAPSAATSPVDAPAIRSVAPVPVRFVYVSAAARDVQLVGEFDGWGEQQIKLRRGADPGVFIVTVALPPEEHEYMFVIDGERWVPDPLAERTRDDGFGQRNSVITI